MKRSREGNVIVLPIDGEVVDVFTGNGWDNWTRLKKEGSTFKILQGAGLDRDQFKEFMKCV